MTPSDEQTSLAEKLSLQPAQSRRSARARETRTRERETPVRDYSSTLSHKDVLPSLVILD